MYVSFHFWDSIIIDDLLLLKATMMDVHTLYLVLATQQDFA